MGLGNLGDLGNLDLGQLQGYLQGVSFPAGKEEVASNAEGNNAPPGAGRADKELGNRELRQRRRGPAEGAGRPVVGGRENRRGVRGPGRRS